LLQTDTGRRTRISGHEAHAMMSLTNLREFTVSSAVLAVALLVCARSAEAIVVGGGGNAGSDCLVVFDAAVNTPASNPRDVRCADGEPCDGDGTVNGVCEFPISMCANSTFDPGNCTLAGVSTVTVEHAEDNGDPKFDPDFQALENRFHSDIGAPPTVNAPDLCFVAPTTIRVAIKGPFSNDRCKKNKKRIKVTSESSVIMGQVYTDVDKITLTCDPSPSGCDPQVLFGGTFDRIQKQIFNQSCALSSCHDSQSQQADLLLETGASLGQLINVTPYTPAAFNEGWLRVTQIDPMTGDPDTSFLVQKIRGEFPGAGFGERMPLDRRKLDKSLIEVITLWVAAGAPAAGWVPGTD
jgi:hypothetical protein